MSPANDFGKTMNEANKIATRRKTLAFLAKVAQCAESAANAASRHGEYASLRDIIAQNEREHRALGKRLVGNIGARMSVSQACDYFVCRVLVLGIKYRTTASLDGMREDYVRGAILMSNRTFQREFFERLKAAFPDMTRKVVFELITMSDYCDLIGERK
jgi:hypothetical protein